jgi:transposase
MEIQHYMARAKLRELQQQYPEWTHRQMAEAIGYSIDWVRKWRQRLRDAPPQDEAVLWGQSRARKTLPPPLDPRVIERILEIRDHPPDHLRRVPGPRAILYYLHRDAAWPASGLRLPRSTRTIWRILDAHGRIYRTPKIEHEPVERPEPMVAWQMDFKDVSSVPADPERKHQHVVETLNVVDVGTSILVAAEVRPDFTEETSILTLAEIFRMNGLPRELAFDRDTRFVGSASGRDFPAALVRFLLCLGIQVRICPPRRPDLNAFVERYHRSYQVECLSVFWPTSLGQACEVTHDYHWHYNHERPNQAVTCQNQPPYVAHPALPKLPPLPAFIDPDRWLEAIHGRRFLRTVGANGTIEVNHERYYIKQAWRGQPVILVVDAYQQEFAVYQGRHLLKRMPIKGLYHAVLPFDEYLDLICKEAETERSRHHRRLGRSW